MRHEIPHRVDSVLSADKGRPERRPRSYARAIRRGRSASARDACSNPSRMELGHALGGAVDQPGEILPSPKPFEEALRAGPPCSTLSDN